MAAAAAFSVLLIFAACYRRPTQKLTVPSDSKSSNRVPHSTLRRAKRKCPDLFDWRQRFSVAVGIARGLEYLHYLVLLGIHDDVKPSNVLLD
ncbi:Receptor-like serine/threonine-protein kinase At4g25390 [Linum perenne]